MDSRLSLLCLPAPNALICPSSHYLLETSLTLALSSSPALSETLLTSRLFSHKMLSKSNHPLVAPSLDKPLPAKYPIQNTPLSPQDLPSLLAVHLEIQYSFLEALNHFVTCANKNKCSELT